MGGVTAELVRGVFFKSRSAKVRDGHQEDAAMTIQSAFRSYLVHLHFGCSNFQARCSNQVMDFNDGKQEHLVETTIHSPESLGTSIKVQTGDSTGTSSVDVESIDLHQLTHKRVRVQVAKLQEDWDDSTVSSTISKIRIQNRIEAATRRERALAYAFAQQLRVCSKKKHTKSKSLDTAMSQSWLERWMATRQPENSLFDNKVNKRIELHNCNDGPIFRNKLMEATAEEESCGSNEISTQIDGNYISRQRTKYYLRPTKSKGKAMRNMSRQQFPGIHRLKEPKVHKNCYQAKDEKGNNGKQKHLENKKEMGCQDFI